MKLYRCLDHGLKMCLLFGHNPQIIFLSPISQMNIVIFVAKMKILGMCMHLLLQFYADSFDTLQVFRSWAEDVHILWI